MLKLRPAVAADMDSLLQLLEQLFTIEQDFTFISDKQRQGLELLLQSGSAHLVVAELSGEVVGMATLQILISTAEGGRAGLVEDVVVSADHRGKGIGQSLLSDLTEWAEKNKLARLQLLADKDNQAALEFYSHQNWSQTSLLAFRKSLA